LSYDDILPSPLLPLLIYFGGLPLDEVQSLKGLPFHKDDCSIKLELMVRGQEHRLVGSRNIPCSGCECLYPKIERGRALFVLDEHGIVSRERIHVGRLANGTNDFAFKLDGMNVFGTLEPLNDLLSGQLPPIGSCGLVDFCKWFH
jgi:hypothetical protein